MEIANRHEPVFAPGTDWGYSNTNYIVLGLLIEKVTGHRAGTALATRIFEPAGMTHTSLPHFDPTLPRPYAHGYAHLTTDAASRLVDVSVCNPSSAWTAGAVVSTAADLDRFWAALLGGKLLSPRMLAAMKQTVPAPGLLGRPVDGRSARYGLGIAALPTTCGTRIWGHDGGIFGYLTTTYATERGKRRIAAAINSFPATAPQKTYTAVARLVDAEFCGTATGKP